MTRSPDIFEAALDEVLTALARSLLQYLDEADPYVDRKHAEARAVLRSLAAGQRASVTEAFDLALARHVTPELGGYPSSFSSHHYVALDFLADALVENQRDVVSAVDAATALKRDPSAKRTLTRIRDRETGHLARLERLHDELRSPVSESP